MIKTIFTYIPFMYGGDIDPNRVCSFFTRAEAEAYQEVTNRKYGYQRWEIIENALFEN